jgi:hypothetical protein
MSNKMHLSSDFATALSKKSPGLVGTKPGVRDFYSIKDWTTQGVTSSLVLTWRAYSLSVGA